ncbi:MAG TPA: carboxypeptidase regulatory-like domain-containing protein [Acidobacteriaceae bacterium]|jgi:hypothetical protein|nr:carboxypeptidase regulatory-like domain-containing protein [Acidobacteriaceae bacterium]
MQARVTLKLTAALSAVLLLQLPAFAQAGGQPTSASTAQIQQAQPIAPAAAATTPAAPAPGTTATTGALRGRAEDPTHAVIPGANITLTSDSGKTYATQSTGDGTYLIPNIDPGTYTVTTQINGFTSYTKAGIKISAGVLTRQNLHLDLEVTTVVTVKSDDHAALSTNPDSNTSTLIISGKDLDALSDDPDELSDELSALAGPAAGPNGGQIYIDGFTGGTLPPKSSIREIRINQNPFSAEYDKIGYGRIEVFTKPGTDKFHGSFQLQGNDNAFNTSALVGSGPQPPYHTLFFQGSLTGPLSKHASFSFGSNYRDIQDNDIVDTTIAGLGPAFTPTPFIQSVFFPQTRIDISPRIDLQITPTNTLTARYQFDRNIATNGGVGGNKLASAGYDSTENNNEIQLSDSQTIGSKIITETRFEYSNNTTSTNALNPIQSNSVQGAFTDFGNSTGIQSDTATHYELQSYTSVQLKNNFVRFGGRLRVDRDANSSTGGFYGTFVYGQTLPTFTSTLQAALPASCQPAAGTAYGTVIPLSGLCNYSVTQAQGPGTFTNVGPTQFNANYGNPAIAASVGDIGLYLEDDWKVRSNITLSGGLRYEAQDRISDHHDLAPRLSIAWGLGTHNSAPLFVIRGGFGIFYDRYGLALVENTDRYNGSAEQQVSVASPTAGGALTYDTCLTALNTRPSCVPAGTGSNITYSQAPDLRAPYTMQTGASVENQPFKPLTLTLTYLNSRGEHQFFAQNTARNAGAAVGAPNIYQYVSEGIFKQNQLIVQATFRGPAGTSLFGYYTFSHANSDISGTSNIIFPSNSSPNNIVADYGRASFDVHQRVFFGGSAPLPYHIVLSPFLIANSGTPFNITLGEDLNGDTIYNDRPAFCSATTTAVNTVNSKYGCFDKGTTLGQPRIPINYAQGPAQFTLNLRVTKTFGFGSYLHGQQPQGGSHRSGGESGGLGAAPSGGGGGGRGGGGGMGFGGGGMGGTNTGRRYNLTLGAQALNLFNVVNYAPPQGVLSSPQFGQQTQLAGGIYSSNSAVRRISLQANFTF